MSINDSAIERQKFLEGKGFNMSAIEQGVLAQWDAIDCFEQSLSLRADAPTFVFYEGPPSANGKPGIHHVISRTLKDLVCRYKTMQGFLVNRKAGWDTHGLPIELGVEKELGITKEDIGKKISVEDYNKKCREAVMRFKDKWEDITRKMGYWVDMEHPYITFENEYIQSLWWALKTLYGKDYLYKSVSIQPYSPAAGTGLSSHELNQPGTYKNVKDTTIVAIFKAIANEQSEWLFKHSAGEAIHFLAWTTTPWTLPSNCGLTVGANIEYVLVHTVNPYLHTPVYVVLAEKLLGKYFKPEGENGDIAGYSKENKVLPYTILASFKGSELENIRYEQLIPLPANTAVATGGDPWRVVLGDFVTTEDGTGIVHTAPAFGADDFKVGKKNNLGILILVDKEGKFIDGCNELSGRYIKNYKDGAGYTEPDIDIAVALKNGGKAFKVEKYEHTYPHCWRTDKPVVYYPLDAWFIRTTAVKDRMIELNKTINWKPKSTGEGRFGNWLENVVDWNLSRSRFWGTPLPIWTTADGSEQKCICSIAELLEGIKEANEKLNLSQSTDSDTLDLHKPYIDNITLVSSSGMPMYREPDLIDVWFDSGAMPFAQLHYPHSPNASEAFKANFPADFIAEGVDQTRGWFYTLHALGVMLFDSVAYRAVISNGLVLDRNGNKMSKRLGNAVDPFETLDTYSADATRWYMMTNAAPWDSLKFDAEGIQEVQRKFFGTLYNTYQFFALYANVDGFCFQEAYIPVAERPEMDKWILSSLHSLVQYVTEKYDDFEPTQAGRAVEYFLDNQLSNWYVRLCRRRFWKGEYEQDKICAYQTLYECLKTISQLIAPISPFFADWLYGNLNSVSGMYDVPSVHLSRFPVADAGCIDNKLENRMKMAQDITTLVLSIRKKVNIKVRQPLQKILIPVLDIEQKADIQSMESIILSELNIKEIEYISGDSSFIRKKIKANFKTLGARLGGLMKQTATAIASFTPEQIMSLERQGNYAIQVNGEEVNIGLQDVEILPDDIPGWSVANNDALTVALDVTISPELYNEGIARELVNRIQKIRKESNLALTDKISVNIQENALIAEAIAQYYDYLCTEILATHIFTVKEVTNGVEVDVYDTMLLISISKNSS